MAYLQFIEVGQNRTLLCNTYVNAAGHGGGVQEISSAHGQDKPSTE